MANQIEAVLDSLKTKLNADLPAKITAVNAENSDDYDIVNPAAITISTRAEIVAYPHVMVLPDSSDPEVDAGTRIIWRHRVRVVSWLSDPNEESLGRKLIRFQRAAREVCLSNRTPGATGGFALRHLRDEYGPVIAQEGFVQGASSMFEVRQQQDI